MLDISVSHIEADRRPTPAPISSNRPELLPRLEPVFRLIEHHYNENLSVARAASEVTMSPSHFRRYFKQATGSPYVRYLQTYRVERACGLMARSDLTLSQIAVEVGFCDQSYFGLVFRRLRRTTPAEFRRAALSGPRTEAVT